MVTPILNYGCEVWGFYKSKAIETVHLHICKRLQVLSKQHKMRSYMGNREELIFSVVGMLVLSSIG